MRIILLYFSHVSGINYYTCGIGIDKWKLGNLINKKRYQEKDICYDFFFRVPWPVIVLLSIERIL